MHKLACSRRGAGPYFISTALLRRVVGRFLPKLGGALWASPLFLSKVPGRCHSGAAAASGRGLDVAHIIRRRVVLGGLGSAAVAGSAPGAGIPDTVPLLFLHLNDIYRYAPEGRYGGLAEMATLIETERAAAKGPVFQTFGGDLISPSLTSSVTHGAHMIQFMDALGTDVAVLGNHEFDFGSEVAKKRIAESRFPWLGANVRSPDGQLFGGAVATVMREADGLRVGFVGVLTRETAQLAPQAEGVVFTSEEDALRSGAAALRRDGADIVVALTHQVLAADLRMASAIGEIDLFLGGHDHEPSELQYPPGAAVIKAASDARWLAVAQLRVTRPDRAQGRAAHVRSLGWKLVPNVDIPPSPRIVPMVVAIEARLAGILAVPLAALHTPLDSRTTTVRTGEAAIGDLVADALRGYFKADVALMNGGGLRGDRVYAAGHVLTRRDLLTEMPFGNVVEKLAVTGATLRAALENGVSGLEQRAGRFPQVSGLAFTFDPAFPAGRRVGTILVGDQKLVPERIYTLATTDYLAAGGDGYTMLAAAKVLVNASGGPLLVNVVAEAISAAGSVSIVPSGRSRLVLR